MSRIVRISIALVLGCAPAASPSAGDAGEQAKALAPTAAPASGAGPLMSEQFDQGTFEIVDPAGRPLALVAATTSLADRTEVWVLPPANPLRIDMPANAARQEIRLARDPMTCADLYALGGRTWPTTPSVVRLRTFLEAEARCDQPARNLLPSGEYRLDDPVDDPVDADGDYEMILLVSTEGHEVWIAGADPGHRPGEQGHGPRGLHQFYRSVRVSDAPIGCAELAARAAAAVAANPGWEPRYVRSVELGTTCP